MKNERIKLYTIGFTKKTAETFFQMLIKNNIKRIVDIRINNSSQLSGFAKADDLKYFAEAIAGIGYIYKPEFAPSSEIIQRYRNKEISWADYEKEYLKLIKKRKISESVDISEFDQNCFLCSEDTPDKCHRRVLTEYFKSYSSNIEIIHLV